MRVRQVRQALLALLLLSPVTMSATEAEPTVVGSELVWADLGISGAGTNSTLAPLEVCQV